MNAKERFAGQTGRMARTIWVTEKSCVKISQDSTLKMLSRAGTIMRGDTVGSKHKAT